MGWYEKESLPQPWGDAADALQILWPVGGYPPRSWVYPLLGIALLIAVCGGVWYYQRQRRAGLGLGDRSYAHGAFPAEGAVPPAKVGLLALHAVFVAAALLNLNATYFQGQGRYLFPAIGVFSMGLAGGWLEWGRSRERLLSWVISGLMFLLGVYALFGVVLPGFRIP